MKSTRTLAVMLLALATLQGAAPVMAASGRTSSSPARTQAHRPDEQETEAQDASPGSDAQDEAQDTEEGGSAQKILKQGIDGEGDEEAGEEATEGEDEDQELEDEEGQASRPAVVLGDEEETGEEGDAVEAPEEDDEGSGVVQRTKGNNRPKKNGVGAAASRTGDISQEDGNKQITTRLRKQFEAIPSIRDPSRDSVVDRRNIAFANVKIAGVEGSFLGISGAALEFEDDVEDFKLARLPRFPKDRSFTTEEVNGTDRALDSERKIFEAIAFRLKQLRQGANANQAEGEILLFTEREPCKSCRGVIKQFSKEFPHIKVTVKNGQNGNFFTNGTEFDENGNRLVRGTDDRVIQRIRPDEDGGGVSARLN